MVVPGADERPAGPGLAQVRVCEVLLVEVPVVVELVGEAPVVDHAAAVGERREGAWVAVGVDQGCGLHLIVQRCLKACPDGLVDEITQVDEELNLVRFVRGDVVVEHLSVRVIEVRPEVLAAHPGQVDHSGVVRGRRRQRSTQIAGVGAGDEAIVVAGLVLESGHEQAQRVIAVSRGRHLLLENQRREVVGGRHLRCDGHRVGPARGGDTASPQHDRRRMRVARCDALAEHVGPHRNSRVGAAVVVAA